MTQPVTGARAAAFLDRDGTVIVDRDYPRDPAGVELLPGAAEAIVRLNRAGIPVILVTNQSGIGRGLITEEQFRAVQGRVEELLQAQGARLDGVYHCPHAPDATPPCECRKPLSGLFRRAARDHGLDPAASWFVGDRLRDVLPAHELGGRAFLVGSTEPEADLGRVPGARRVPSLLDAVQRILQGAQIDAG